ncbi:hypothetical protein [Catellatospora vulcania]|uniref:hypothetical protein n=1 Tax=Catellatospora vulcania TaxID=1460450 RepID=UPI0012D395FF|nr:hypothetical protein [Catellatospora vulcania]
MKKSSAVVLLLAPLMLTAYGLVRIVGKSDGVYGPGLDWQAAHLLALAGMVLFVPGIRSLAGLLPRGPWRTGAVVLSLAGLAASMVQFGADIWFGLRAADKAGMRELSQSFGDIPGVDLVVYQVGPQLFFVGLLVLSVLLARAKRLPWWSPVVLLAGIASAAVSLDLLPVSGLLMLAALWPATRGGSAATPTSGRAATSTGDSGTVTATGDQDAAARRGGGGIVHIRAEVPAGPPPRVTP